MILQDVLQGIFKNDIFFNLGYLYIDAFDKNVLGAEVSQILITVTMIFSVLNLNKNMKEKHLT